MSNIIGNQEQRTSKVDTEKWKEHSAYYSNPENIKKKNEDIPIDMQNLEKKILKYLPSGLPIIELHEISEVAVKIGTPEEHDTMMQIYQSGGWQCEVLKDMAGGASATLCNYATESKNKCVTVQKIFQFDYEKNLDALNYDIWDTSFFYNIQGITPEIIKELNKWYDENHSNRICKGK